jgi:hypothetical protein
MWHPIEDLRSLREYRQEGSLGYTAYARSLFHRQHFPLLSLDDPGPSLASLSIRARRLRAKASPAALMRARAADGAA